MERRRKGARAITPAGRVTGTPAPSEAAPNSVSPSWAHIQALLDAGGQLMIGTIAPIHGAAVAHDGQKTLAMLRHRPGEEVHELLARLDAAIAKAKSTGSRVDEINTTKSDRRYEI